MKTIYSLFIACLFVINLNAQNSYAEAMQKGLSDFGKAQSAEELIAAANQFERVGSVETNEWLPNYYAGLIQVIVTFQTEDLAKKEAYLEKAQLMIDKAMQMSAEESELHTLQGMWYQAYIGLDPMQNGMVYSGKANASFQNALAYNPSNPRPIYLQAVSVMHTPEQYGGGKKIACPMFQQAQQMFDGFETEMEFAPDWGGDDCTKYLSACSEVAEK